MYQYRLYPSQKQREHLFENFNICKEIYNDLLEISIKTYKETGKTLRKYDFDKLLTGLHPKVFSQVKQNISDRVHKSFQNFFRRCKDTSSKKKGFPRFKSRVNSITYPQCAPHGGFKFISDKRLYASKIGNIPIILHRVPKGKVKTLTIKRNRADQWFAIFACEVDVKPVKNTSKKEIGIDVGLTSFATTSDGVFVANPRYLVKAEKRLKLLSRRLSRKKKVSKNRTKSKHLLAKQHLKVSNQRTDFLHKLSHDLTRNNKTIVVEDLNIKGMLHNHHLAKHISDASWNNFIHMLSYKAVTCGGQLVKVNPRNTSKTCSNCGAIADMPLNQRMYRCGVCGFVCHRDINASINILKIGQGLPESNACGHDVRPPTEEAVVVEAGTILGNS
jgi:putative transposase